MSSRQSPSRSPERLQAPGARSYLPSPSRISEALEKPLHYESPSKYDLDFYQRKVNRLENDLNHRQDEINIMRFRLQKAEDFEIKYELLVKENQELTLENEALEKGLVLKGRELEELVGKYRELELTLGRKVNELQSSKGELENAKKRQEQLIEKSSQSGVSDREKAEQQFFRQIEQLKDRHKDAENKLSGEISELKDQIAHKVLTEEATNARLAKIRTDKDAEIKRLRDQVRALQTEVTNLRESCNTRVTEVRRENQESSSERGRELAAIAETSKNLLMREIEHLKETIRVKNEEIRQLLAAESEFVRQHEAIVNELQEEVRHLQDKIFEIHRDHEQELFSTIERLQQEHEDNEARAKQEFARIEGQYEDRVRDLNGQIAKHREEKDVLVKSLRSAEENVHKTSADREYVVGQLSKKIIEMEAMKDEEVRNLTTSMRLIENEAEIRLRDLHTAMLGKNAEFEILNKQVELKNTEISHLLDEINALRTENRRKLEHLDDAYAKEQSLLNETLTEMRRINGQLKRELTETRGELEDKEKQFELEKDLARNELNLEKEANARLSSKNQMLAGYVKQLESDVKEERGRNVEVIQDTNVTRREILQEREKVRGELEVIKQKEVDQLRNIFNIDLNKLRNENNNLLHKLRDRSDQYDKLLKDFKDLEDRTKDKVSAKLSREEDIAKRKATLECEINLVRNIANAINLKKGKSGAGDQ